MLFYYNSRDNFKQFEISNYSRVLFELRSLVPCTTGMAPELTRISDFSSGIKNKNNCKCSKKKKHFLSKTICNRKQSMLLDCCKRVFEGHKFCYIINWNFLFRIDISNYLAIKLACVIRSVVATAFQSIFY